MTDPWLVKAAEIRSKIASLRQRHPEESEAVFEVVLILDELEKLYRGQADHPGGESRAKQDRPRRGRRVYRRRIDAGQAYLTESRPSGQPPYRVPKTVYDAAATAMAQAKKPMDFRAWHRATQKVLGESCQDYLCRVVMRFWKESIPTSLRKTGTRYEATDPGAFPKQASDAFASLEPAE